MSHTVWINWRQDVWMAQALGPKGVYKARKPYGKQFRTNISGSEYSKIDEKVLVGTTSGDSIITAVSGHHSALAEIQPWLLTVSLTVRLSFIFFAPNNRGVFTIVAFFYLHIRISGVYVSMIASMISSLVSAAVFFGFDSSFSSAKY